MARLFPAPRAPQPLAETELGPRALERRRHPFVEGERLVERFVEAVVGSEEPTAPSRRSNPPLNAGVTATSCEDVEVVRELRRNERADLR
jgi:hypothetical protein